MKVQYENNVSQKSSVLSLRLAQATVEVEHLPGGGMILSSPDKLKSYPRRLGDHLCYWASEAGERVFLAEKNPAGSWNKYTYSRVLHEVESLAQGLLDRGYDTDRPVIVLSENSINFALLKLACYYIGLPIAPISPAYSLQSTDHVKLRHVFNTLRPGLVYAASGKRFNKALNALNLEGVEVVVDNELPAKHKATFFSDLAVTPGKAVREAFSRVGPDTVAKILFTSGSTDLPKGVINTHGMLCSNQQSIAQIWPFLEDRPPLLLDWLPWNHTYGGNKLFNIILRNGGTFYIDSGRPLPGAIETTVENLREVSPTISFNVPRGYDALLPYLENDASVRSSFFRNLDMIFYAAASLPQHIWKRLVELAIKERGKKIFMASGWGSTETSPCITMVHYPIEKAGIIGLPMPGVKLKMIPNQGKLEMRVRGPNITPGYYKRPDLTKEAFDDEGYFRTGDAGRFIDPENPARGIAFDGRITENFKLTTGTWVNTGSLRLEVIKAAEPLIQDAVVTGHDQDYIGLLVWLKPEQCLKLAPEAEGDLEALMRAPEVIDCLRRKLQAHNKLQSGSSTYIKRVLLLTEPPSLDANEITDKGYINQQATLERRAALVERLYSEPPPDDVIEL